MDCGALRKDGSCGEEGTERGFASPLSEAPAFVLLLGVVSCVFFLDRGFPPFIAFLSAFLLTSAWTLLGTERIQKGTPTVFLIILPLFCLMFFRMYTALSSEKNFPEIIEGRGRITLNREWGRRRALIISSPPGRFVFYSWGNAPPEGAVVRFRAAAKGFARAGKSGGFDEKLFWRAKGADSKAVMLKIKELEPPRGFYAFKNFLIERISGTLPPRMSAYISAVTVGRGEKFLFEEHRKAGTAHLLAVSGFHVALLGWLTGLVFRRGRLRIFAISCAMWLYVALAGLPVGGIRAAVMVQIYLAGKLIGRPSSGFNSVSAAGLLMLSYNPWVCFDTGWRLSLSAALTLCAAVPAFAVKKFLGFFASLLVWLVTAPLIAFMYKGAPLAGILLNAAALPLFALLFPLIILLALPSLLGLPFASAPAFLGEYVLEAWRIFSDTAVGLVPGGVGYSDALLLCALFVFLSCCAFASGFPKRRIGVVSAAFALFFTILATMM